ncbi:hypothetical protein NDU88_004948 [Pleurodeles waltl]|uniref:Uncharacterized protein n=1 Tax=Pleurodeles waltl TaxID=8319 RepID=A0AAV7TU86_PLEWA|nr:hypothetical protein NDU88_004948 [Pleurodeles waltl]
MIGAEAVPEGLDRGEGGDQQGEGPGRGESQLPQGQEIPSSSCAQRLRVHPCDNAPATRSQIAPRTQGTSPLLAVGRRAWAAGHNSRDQQVRCPADPRRAAAAVPGDQQDPVGSTEMGGTPRQGGTARNSVLPEVPKLQALMVPLVMPVDWSSLSQTRAAQPGRSTSSVREPRYHPQLLRQRSPDAQLSAWSAV